MPTRDYLSIPLPEFAIWIKNFASNLPGAMETKYSVPAAAMAQLGLDAAWVEYWVPAKAEVEDQSEAVNKLVEKAVDGNLGGPALTNPAVGVPAGTPAVVPQGIKKRIREIVNGIKSQKSIYVEVDGEYLGFEGEGTVIDPNTLLPTLLAKAGQSNFLYSVIVGNRKGYDMWELEAQVVGSAQWTTVGRFDGKSQDITYQPAAGNDGPVQLNLRVRIWKAGSFVGLYSPTVTITVNP